MKTEVSRWQRIECRALNKNKRMALIVFIMSALSVDLACAAPGGFIKFHGHITQASCEARNASQPRLHEHLLRISADISITVNTAGNACSYPAVPFTLAYEPLPILANSTVQGRSGVVTMTYE